MKEYIAKTGGRYTYNDDLLNLQELAMSMTAIFDGCSNFIISGCHVAGGKITPGFVWINGRVRRFEGAADPVFPFFIWEENHYETISYVGDVNKHGRCCYLTAGGGAVPTIKDEVTGELPGFIEVREDYAPRFIDKFIGRYAVLLDSPFARQTVRKDLVLAGMLSVEKDIESKTGVSVVGAGYALRGIVKESGNGSVGLYSGGLLLVSEIEIATDGTFTLWRQGVKLATFDTNGMKTDHLTSSVADAGALRITADNLFNRTDATDEGAVQVNRHGYNGGNARYRNFIVYDGRTANPLLTVEGKSSRVTVGGAFSVNSGGQGIVLRNPTYAKTETRLINLLEWQDKNNDRIGYAGYIAGDTFEMTVRNEVGNIVLHPNGWVDVRGELRVGGVNIADTYIKVSDCNTALSKKVDKAAGKGLSTEDFTTEYRRKLDSIAGGQISAEGDGFVSAGDVAEALRTKLNAASNLADLKDIPTARANLKVYSTEQTDNMLAKKLDTKTFEAVDFDSFVRRDKMLGDLKLPKENDKRLACQAIGAAYAPEYEQKIADTGWVECGGENAGTLFARQIGNIVCIQGRINTARRSSNTWGSIATIPNVISPPKYGCLQTLGNFDDHEKHNRGCTFVINGGSRTIQMYERGTYNWDTELSFTYMT